MTSTEHIYGQLARALMAQRDGQFEEARRTTDAITSAHPQWKADARREIGKLIFAPWIAGRLLHDLAAVGLLAPAEPGDGRTVH